MSLVLVLGVDIGDIGSGLSVRIACLFAMTQKVLQVLYGSHA